MQTTARRSGIPIDSLSFEYSIVNVEEQELQQPPKEGVYVKVCPYMHAPASCVGPTVPLSALHACASKLCQTHCAPVSLSITECLQLCSKWAAQPQDHWSSGWQHATKRLPSSTKAQQLSKQMSSEACRHRMLPTLTRALQQIPAIRPGLPFAGHVPRRCWLGLGQWLPL